ncbi:MULTISPECIES: cupin domain-containing protein [Halocynthiibacter]|uniref:Cupin domain-containing protein n=1 Tax=Halocynthiibacter halioticoli TaxID=2986804 RepID=A0AAE3J1J4_9RHOB|nr:MULTISPECIES: cupin domain-containing protein [Halocynthiibacter]MCV6824843.1 cupin domain-containing protein [Halocynthiibacter halioticoli]MCW4057844.1 cupin domain-containing protein [Halocynthiibacter sp. SDUM655004]
MSISKTAPSASDLLASWRYTGANSPAMAAGIAQIGAHGDICFALSANAIQGSDIHGCEKIDDVVAPFALRVDEVAFPIGAIAHRHTHAGAGWRYLVSGSLRIETEHGAEVMEPGMSWFEPADNPVRAVALQKSGDTRFVRCMVIPHSYVGRSTFNLCDPKDADLPRLQVTHRHFDHAF